MKKYLLPLLLFCLLFVLLLIYSDTQKSDQIITQTTEKPEVKGEKDEGISFNFNQEEIKVNYFKSPNENFTLETNLPEKLTSEEIIEKENCKSLFNGSFYGKDNKPIGLFISKGTVISEVQNNRLFNGFLLIDKAMNIQISDRYTQNTQYYALQSGPLLIREGRVQTLDLTTDEHARRVVAALDKNNNLLFFVFYDPNSVFSGPSLRDLPQVLKRTDEMMKIGIVSALNLDGGSASVFINNGIKLSELSPIGSYFCFE